VKTVIATLAVLLLAACGGNIPCAQAGGTCAAVCGAGTDMACSADCGTSGICCLPTVNGRANDCH
jgi:hypothetical protein